MLDYLGCACTKVVSWVLANIGELALFYRSASFLGLFNKKLFCFLTDPKFLFPRCSQLDSALNEATSQVRTLEKKNNLLEIEVVCACLRAGSSA